MKTKKRNKFRKGKAAGNVFVLACFVTSGILLAFPFVSDYLNSHSAQSVIRTYQQKTEELNTEETDMMFTEARIYNSLLVKNQISLADAFDTEESGVSVSPSSALTDEDGTTYDYETLLNMDDSGVMAYLEVPKIQIYLPIYHGTSNSVLQTAVGHLEGSSLPVGGESTHVVLSGHTGLRTARLFSDLTELSEGDYFFIHVLGETLAYCVDQILVVEPDDVSALQIEDGMDYVTLVTCTPYGINSHRLLVRGVRTDYEEAEEKVSNSESVQHSSQWMREYVRALLAGILILVLIILLLTMVRWIRKKKRSGHQKTGEEP